jgi:predicted kinase
MDMIQQKPKLVLMAGFGGSGKTTLAHTLGTRLKWPVLDKDVLKTRILHTSHEMPLEKASMMAYDLLFVLAQEFLVQQQLSVILDTSAAFPPVMDSASALAEIADAHLKIIFCKAGRHIRHARLQRRNAQDGGRRQLLINLATIDEDNWQFFDHLPLEYLIELDTSQPFEQYLQKALYYLHEERPGLCPLFPQFPPR